MFIHVSGIPRISPIFALAAAAAADVPTNVFGDGLEDSLGDGASTSAVVDEDVSPPSSWSHPDMASTFMSLVVINPDRWGETKHLGPSTVPVVRLWTASDSGFCPFQRDPSLYAPFGRQ